MYYLKITSNDGKKEKTWVIGSRNELPKDFRYFYNMLENDYKLVRLDGQVNNVTVSLSVIDIENTSTQINEFIVDMAEYDLEQLTKHNASIELETRLDTVFKKLSEIDLDGSTR